MKLSFAGFLAIAAGMAAFPCSAQTTTAPLPVPSQPTPAKPPSSQPGGKVIFSRSTGAGGQNQTAPASPQAKMLTEPSAEDAEREAVTFTGFDMDVRLRPADQHIAVRALVTVRNDGKKPLAHIPLQISSSLNWERIRVDGKGCRRSGGRA